MAKKVRKSKPKITKKGISFKLSKQNKVILGSLLVILSMAMFFSFISFYFAWQNDQSILTEFSDRNEQANNLLNKFGAIVSHMFMYKGFGLASFIIPVLLCLSGLYMFLGIHKPDMLKKWIWGLIFVIWASIAFGFFALEQPLLGGLVGYEMNNFLKDYIGKVGIMLLLLFGLIFILVRLFKFSPEDIANQYRAKRDSLAAELKSTPNKKSKASVNLKPEYETPIVIDTFTHKENIPHLTPEPILDDFEINIPVEEEMKEELTMEVKKNVEEKPEKKNTADKLVEDFGEFDPTLELGNYKFPSLDLLDNHGSSKGIDVQDESVRKELDEKKK